MIRRDRRGPRRHVAVFVGVCVATVALAGFALFEAAGDRPGDTDTVAATATIPPAQIVDEPHLLFRETGTEDTSYGRLSIAPLADADGERAVTELSCEVVHYRAGRGLCLAADRGILTTYEAVVFDAEFAVRHEFGLNGGPSRARVAPDGRLAALTVFVTGHSYAVAGFSTETLLVDLETGERLANIEEWDVTRDGETFSAVDFNFWGVTWAPEPGRFYATLGTGGETYLVEGDVDEQRMHVLRENVECPSLSPDGTTIVFKKRVDGGAGPVVWRLHALDLATMSERPLAEERNVDDQVEWLDDRQVVYAVPEGDASSARTDVWVVAVDDDEPPRPFADGAFSPTVVR